MKKSRTKKAFINTIAGISVKIITLVTSFLLRTVFIKTLGMEYNGVSGLFTDILTILSFAELGMGTAITHALYKPIAIKDEKQISMLMNFYKHAYTLIALVVFVGGLALMPFLDLFIKNTPDVRESIRLIFILYVINASGSYLFIYKSTLFSANQQEYIIYRWNCIITVIQLVFQVIFLLLFKNFIIYLIINIVGTFVLNVIISHLVDKQFTFINVHKKEKLPKQRVKEIMADVRALILYKVSGVVMNGTDSIIASKFLGIISVGIFSNYKLIIKHINTIISQFFSATTASIGNLAAEKDSEYQYITFHKLLFLCFWCYCFFSTSLFVLLNPFVGGIWLGEKNTFSVWFVLVISAEFYFKGMMSPISSFRTANGLFVNGKYRPVIMALLNIVISILLVNFIGITGILIGTVISRLLTQVWYDPLLLYQKVFHKNFLEYIKKYGSYLLITQFSWVVSYFISNLIKLKSVYFDFLCKGVVCLLIPNIIIILVYRNTFEYKFVKQTLSKAGATIKNKLRGS